MNGTPAKAKHDKQMDGSITGKAHTLTQQQNYCHMQERSEYVCDMYVVAIGSVHRSNTRKKCV